MASQSFLSDIEKSFEDFNSSISGIQEAFGQIQKQINSYQDVDIVPRDYLKEMAGNLAHEIRNPLGGIATHVELLSSDSDEQQSRSIECILEGVYRIDKIVENLIVFSRPIMLQTIRCNFCDTIASAVEAVRQQLPDASQYSLSTYLPIREVYVKIDPILVLQALQNLLINAIENMPKGGNIILALSENQRLGKLVLCIGDAGPGLRDNDTEKPFYPFYTTKTNGMGLGLPTSRLIIEKHGGRLWLKDQLKQGAVAILKLPTN
jgi:signal transduction histidine kinase